MSLAPLHDIVLWQTTSIREQDELIQELRFAIGNDFVHQHTSCYTNKPGLRIPTFVHRSTGLEFNLIIGGDFEMGLSPAEESSARLIDGGSQLEPEVMRPVHKVTVRPFLITRFPILDTFARSHIPIDPGLFRPEFGEDGHHIPIYLSRVEVELLAEQTGFSLPSEAQWEYACRGTTKTLFYFGDSLPDEEILDKEILITDFSDEAKNRNGSNPFGLVGLSTGEWCQDTFKENYHGARPDDLPVSEVPPYVVRGGAGALWPWQDNWEWLLCMSAMRRSSDTIEDGTCGARLVKRLELSLAS